MILIIALLWLHAIPSRAYDGIRDQLHAECGCD